MARETRIRLAVGALLLGLSGCAPAAPVATPAPVGAATGTTATSVSAAGGVDYRSDASWLCRPGREDACVTDLSATVIQPDGSLRVEEWRPNPTASVDCFYVYPTVSLQPTPNATIAVTAAERNVAVSQFARFASQCRTFAPLYRQMTLAALRTGIGGGTPIESPMEIAYQDVRDAWNDYLARDNAGRGVILFGHSQGSIMLTRLLQEEIEGRPIQDRIISAYLIGWNVMVPEGRDVGGDFQRMPLCRTRTQTGCIVTYVSFRETDPPAVNALFGRSAVPGMQVACTHPANLGRGRGELDAYLAVDRTGMEPWVQGQRIETPFVKVPGMLFGECVTDEHGSYLAVSIAERAGPRTNLIGGDVRNPDGSINAMWGLHLLDVPLGMGNLVSLAGEQSRAYLGRARR
jgi:hypothetical protein